MAEIKPYTLIVGGPAQQRLNWRTDCVQVYNLNSGKIETISHTQFCNWYELGWVDYRNCYPDIGDYIEDEWEQSVLMYDDYQA